MKYIIKCRVNGKPNILCDDVDEKILRFDTLEEARFARDYIIKEYKEIPFTDFEITKGKSIIEYISMDYYDVDNAS